MTKRRHYVQFSKKVVVAVTIAVTTICLVSIVLMWSGQGMEYMADIVKAYIGYAMVVFAAYSGNSAVEKWLTKRGPSVTITSGDTAENDDTEEEEG